MGDGMYLDPRIGADENPKYLIKDDDGNDLYVDRYHLDLHRNTKILKVLGHRESPPWWEGPDPREIPHNQK